MAVVFFEGFNDWLDPTYWTYTQLSPFMGFAIEGSQRTNNWLGIPNREWNAEPTQNSKITLSNFGNPLADATCLGVGFFVPAPTLHSRNIQAAESPYAEILWSMETDAGTLSVEVVRPSQTVLGLRFTQAGVELGTLDLVPPGVSWGVSSTGWDGWGTQAHITHNLYLEFFINAAAGTYSVRAAGANTLSTILPVISSPGTMTPFTAVSSLTLYGSSRMGPGNGPNDSRRFYDDFYLTNGNSISDVYLGSDTRIIRLNPNYGGVVVNDWQTPPQGGDPGSNISSMDNDSSYMRTTVSGANILANIEDLPGWTPAYVSGVKINSYTRKAGIENVKFRHIIAPNASTSGADATLIGNEVTVNYETYQQRGVLLLQNPMTEGPWTKSAVNSMTLGLRNTTPAS